MKTAFMSDKAMISIGGAADAAPLFFCKTCLHFASYSVIIEETALYLILKPNTRLFLHIIQYVVAFRASLNCILCLAA